MSHGGSEGCGAADDGGTGEPFETGGLCVGEEGSTDGNKTSEMTCQSKKKNVQNGNVQNTVYKQAFPF